MYVYYLFFLCFVMYMYIYLLDINFKNENDKIVELFQLLSCYFFFDILIYKINKFGDKIVFVYLGENLRFKWFIKRI